jgi:hypothetical protein
MIAPPQKEIQKHQNNHRAKDYKIMKKPAKLDNYIVAHLKDHPNVKISTLIIYTQSNTLSLSTKMIIRTNINAKKAINRTDQ